MELLTRLVPNTLIHMSPWRGFLIQMWENCWFAFKINMKARPVNHHLLSAVAWTSGQINGCGLNFPILTEQSIELVFVVRIESSVLLAIVSVALVGNSLDIADLRSVSFHFCTTSDELADFLL